MWEKWVTKQANNYIYFLETDNEYFQESDRIFSQHGNHFSSYEQSVADIILYLILWRHGCDQPRDTHSQVDHIFNCRTQH